MEGKGGKIQLYGTKDQNSRRYHPERLGRSPALRFDLATNLNKEKFTVVVAAGASPDGELFGGSTSAE